MIHLFVWPLVIIALSVNNDTFKRFCITIGIIGSIATIVIGAQTWPIQLIVVAFYWVGAYLIAAIIRWIIKAARKSE